MCGLTNDQVRGGVGGRSGALPVTDPGASSSAGDAAASSRRSLAGFAANILTTEEERRRGSIATKILLGQ